MPAVDGMIDSATVSDVGQESVSNARVVFHRFDEGRVSVFVGDADWSDARVVAEGRRLETNDAEEMRRILWFANVITSDIIKLRVV